MSDDLLDHLPPLRPLSDLARARMRKGWTQARLAREVGCSQGTVSTAERGAISPAMARRCAAALGVPVESIRRPPYRTTPGVKP